MNSRLKILWVGAGDLARRTAIKLDTESYEMFGLSRSIPEDHSFVHLRGDATDPQVAEDVAALGFDVIVFTLTPQARTESAYRQSYLRAVENFTRVISPVTTRILFVSSSSVYGQNRGEWIDENSATEPTGFSGRVMLETEQAVRDWGGEFSIVRFSGIYGPGRLRVIGQLQAGKPLKNDQVWSNRIHSEDCAGVLSHILRMWKDNKTLPPIILASDSYPVLQYEFRSWLATQLGLTYLPTDMDGDQAGKRCDNRLLLDLGYRFEYPGYRDGYGKLVSSLSSPD